MQGNYYKRIEYNMLRIKAILLVIFAFALLGVCVVVGYIFDLINVVLK